MMGEHGKIDIHLHLAPESLSAGNGMKVSGGGEMIPHLEELGICQGILMSGGEDGGMMPFGKNDENRELCRKYPERYNWMCNVDERDPETLAERLAEYQRQGAVGIGELMINRRLNHPLLQKLFAEAEKLQLPVLFHMSPEEGFGYGVVDEPGLPLLENVLKTYEKLTVIGHSQPFWHEISGDAESGREERNAWGKGPVTPGGRLVELFEKHPNLYGDLSAHSGGCAIMRDPEFGLEFLERFSSRLMFATDMVNTEMTFPLGAWLDEQAAAGRLSGKAYRAICFENARRIFGIA